MFRPGDFNGVILALIDSNSLVSCGMLDEKKVDPDLWTGTAGPDLHARQGRGAVSGRVERRRSNPAALGLRGIMPVSRCSPPEISCTARHSAYSSDANAPFTRHGPGTRNDAFTELRSSGISMSLTGSSVG